MKHKKDKKKTTIPKQFRRPRSESAHPKSVCSFILLKWNPKVFVFLYNLLSPTLYALITHLYCFSTVPVESRSPPFCIYVLKVLKSCICFRLPPSSTSSSFLLLRLHLLFSDGPSWLLHLPLPPSTTFSLLILPFYWFVSMYTKGFLSNVGKGKV